MFQKKKKCIYLNMFHIQLFGIKNYITNKKCNKFRKSKFYVFLCLTGFIVIFLHVKSMELDKNYDKTCWKASFE